MRNNPNENFISASALEPNHPIVRPIRRAYLEVRQGMPADYDVFKAEHHAKNYERTRLACVEALATSGRLPLWRGTERIPAWIELSLTEVKHDFGDRY